MHRTERTAEDRRWILYGVAAGVACMAALAAVIVVGVAGGAL